MEGFQVETARDGLEALVKVNEFKPHLMVLDIMMPHMDGYEVARKVRESKDFDSVYIIALTAKGQERDKTRSVQAGIDEHVTKPFHPTYLIDRIKEILKV